MMKPFNLYNLGVTRVDFLSINMDGEFQHTLFLSSIIDNQYNVARVLNRHHKSSMI